MSRLTLASLNKRIRALEKKLAKEFDEIEVVGFRIEQSTNDDAPEIPAEFRKKKAP